MSDTSKVGMVGVGLLGSAIAQRLLDGGHLVQGFDTDPDQLKSFAQQGGRCSLDAAEVIRDCTVLILSLPTSESVAELIARYRADFHSGQTVMDTTTGDPAQVVAIGKSLSELGVQYVEANVAGSSDQMRRGQAKLFIGGQQSIIDQLHPILDLLADSRYYLGPIGTASRMKLVHNLVLGLNRAALAEGLAFAEVLGIEPREALQILAQTPAASAVMKTKGERMASGDYRPQARLAQHLKDVRLILTESERASCKTPLSQLHQALLETAVELGFGDSDNSAIIEVFRWSMERQE